MDTQEFIPRRIHTLWARPVTSTPVPVMCLCTMLVSGVRVPVRRTSYHSPVLSGTALLPGLGHLTVRVLGCASRYQTAVTCVMCYVLVWSRRVAVRLLRETEAVGAAAPCGVGPPCGAVGFIEYS